MDDEDIQDTREEEKLLSNDGPYPQEKSYTDTLKGIAAALATVIFHGTGAVCVTLLERRIPDFELNMFRSLLPLVVYSIYFAAKSTWPVSVVKENSVITCLYVTAAFSAVTCYFIAVSLLPAALVSCGSYVSCLIAGIILFAVFAEEFITVKRLVFVGLCVVGILLVDQPWSERSILAITRSTSTSVEKAAIHSVTEALYNNNTTTLGNRSTAGYHTDHLIGTNQSHMPGVSIDLLKDSNESQTEALDIYRSNDMTTMGNATFNDQHQVNGTHHSDEALVQGSQLESQNEGGAIVGYVLVVAAGISMAFHPLLLKRNAFLGDHFHEVLFWCFLALSLISLIVTFALESPMLPSNWFDTAMVVLHSVACAISWPFYITAPRLISANAFTIILTTEVVYMLVAQYTVLSSILPGHRNWMEVVGVVLVLLGGTMSSILELISDTKKKIETHNSDHH